MPRVLMVLRAERGGEFGHVKKLASELPRRGVEIAVCGPYAGREDELGVPVYDVPMAREPSPAADARAFAGVVAAIRDYRPDLIHAHGSKGGVLARLARVAAPRTPVIYSPHQYGFVNYFPSRARRFAFKLVERGMAPLTTRVLAVCDAEAEHAREVWVGGRARSVHNGIEPLQPPTEPDPMIARLRESGPVIVAIAELHVRKGVITLIEALAALHAEHPGASVVVAGEGDERPALERRARELGVADSVHLIGEIDGVRGLLDGGTVFVNPAWAEAFPYAVIEAMSLAKPIVATDVGGTGEAIVDDETGRLVPARDPAALATAIGDLLSNPGPAARLAAAAGRRMRERFTIERMVEGTLGVYGELGVEARDPGEAGNDR